MADKAISELTELTTAPVANDELAIVDTSASETKRISVNSLFMFPGANGLTDDTYSGFCISGIAAGETIAQWNLVYLDDTENEWMKADGDAAGKWPARGIAVEAGSNGAAMKVMVLGVIRNDTWTWTGEGKTLYLSDDPTTTNGITETALAGSGDCIQIVGFSLSDDEAFFNFTGVYAELT